MAALFAATITYAPASTAAISSARIVGVWVRLFIAESPRFYRSESNAGLPFWITHTAGLDWKVPLPGALVSGPPSHRTWQCFGYTRRDSPRARTLARSC